MPFTKGNADIAVQLEKCPFGGNRVCPINSECQHSQQFFGLLLRKTGICKNPQFSGSGRFLPWLYLRDPLDRFSAVLRFI